MYVLGGILVLFCALWGFNEDNLNEVLFGITITVGFSFIGLGIWSEKNPAKAILTGLIIYSCFALITFLILWFWHAMVLSAFIYGLNSAKKGEKLMEKLPPHLRKWN